jgi:glycosyltransferase involved in cell wall biosynthesis
MKLALRRLYHLKTGILAHGGGWRQTLNKALFVWRNEGWSGLRHRLVNLGAVANGIPVTNSSGAQVLRNDYQEWVRRYAQLDEVSRLHLLQRVDALENPPLISIIMPVFNPRMSWLIEAIESVRSQLYPHWQLCIADDSSSDIQVRMRLADYAANDSRICFIQRESNGHIAEASNSALALATGDWVTFLDQDDLLPEHALCLVADSVSRHPQAQLLYSDEDKIDAQGQRHSPYFKSAWNTDLFYSHNLITHLAVYRKTLIDQLKGFRSGYDGAQDYDLALRCIEHLQPNEILHIPHVLYHWRSHIGSTADNPAAKPYAIQAGERALRDHFKRQGISCQVSSTANGYRVTYDLPNPPPLVSIVITSRNAADLLKACINSLVNITQYPSYEIILVNNDSDTPDALAYLKHLADTSQVRIVPGPGPFNYSALNNLGVSHARGSLICLLNNDIEAFDAQWLNELVMHACRPGVGIVGAKLLYPNLTLQHAGIVLGINSWAGHPHKGQPAKTRGRWARAAMVSGFSAVTGACLMIRKSLYEQLGGLNETDLAIACSDVDLCLRTLQLGQRIVWTPYARLYHHESATRGYDITPENSARLCSEVAYMQQHWAIWLSEDPAYNPNLSLEHEDFSLSWPPRVRLHDIATSVRLNFHLVPSSSNGAV